MRRSLLIPALSLTLLSALNASPEKIARSVTIYRDTWGVPHVYGPTDASCAFGYAYAQAEDNFWQVEDSYIRSLGRAAEVHGHYSRVAGWRIKLMDWEALNFGVMEVFVLGLLAGGWGHADAVPGHRCRSGV